MKFFIFIAKLAITIIVAIMLGLLTSASSAEIVIFALLMSLATDIAEIAVKLGV